MTVSNSNQQSSTIVEFIKSQIDITDLISKYVDLNGTSKVKKGLCPFYPEKTPSFIVSPGRQTWHCFGACSTGGDLISFVMKRESMEFGESIRLLADRAGISIGTPIIQTKSTSIYEVNESAAKFFSDLLHSSTSYLFPN